MRRKNLMKILVLFMLTALVLAACANKDEGNEVELEETKEEEEIFNPEPNPDAKQVSSYDDERIKKQEAIEQEIEEAYENGSYTFDKPFVRLNPYGVSPLTALIKFETMEPTEIEVVVGNEEGQATISKKWEGFETNHNIPVLGLYPDADNIVVLNAYDEDGNKKSTEVSIQTEPVPDEIPKTELVESQPEQMEDGLTFIVPGKNVLYAVDENADIRWYADMPYRLIFNRLDNGNILVNTKTEDEEKYTDLLEMDMLGKVENAYKIENDNYEEGNLLHHDVIELPSGNLLATVHDPDTKYVEDYMVEIDRRSGKTVQEIDLKDVFPEAAYEDYSGEYADRHDWFHQNSIWFDETDNTIVISGRHQDAVMKLSYPDAKIKWILAAHEGWSKEHEEYLLEPEDDNVKFPAAQHAAKVLPDMDNNEDTSDVIIFDNNHVVTRGDKDIGDTYSRMVQYRINEKDMTVEEVWSYGEVRGESFYSDIVGNAQYLPDTGNRLITSGHIAPIEDAKERSSIIVETNDKTDADVVYEIKISGFEKDDGKLAYRALRLPLYP